MIEQVKEFKQEEYLKEYGITAEIMLESHKPDTDILYWYIRKNQIIVVELNEFEFKDRVIALSTIRNFRKRLRDFLEKKDLALKTAYDLKIKEKQMKYTKKIKNIFHKSMTLWVVIYKHKKIKNIFLE